MEGRHGEVGIDRGGDVGGVGGTAGHSRLDVRVGVNVRPHSPQTIDLSVVEEKDGVESRVVEVGHVATAASEGVDRVVHRLQTVNSRAVPGSDKGLVGEDIEASVCSEEVVQAGRKRSAVVVEDGQNQIVLADGAGVVGGRVTLGDGPRCELESISTCRNFH